MHKELQTKLWGWGQRDIRFGLFQKDEFLKYLEEQFSGPLSVSSLADAKHEVTTRSLQPGLSRIEPRIKTNLEGMIGKEWVTDSAEQRLFHAFGKSYPDQIRILTGKLEHAPDLVVYPAGEDDLIRILALCSQERISVVPFGAGSTVVGGVAALSRDQRPVIVLNLSRLNRILEVDPVSLTATIEAGILGPALERELNAQGLSLGHFPQSFEFSSLGGWVATRSAGQNSTRYGKIEEMVLGLRMITPSGQIDYEAFRHRACGPDGLESLIGSEGVLGIITRVRLKVHQKPSHRRYHGILFHSFHDATEAARSLIQSLVPAALIRVSDETETKASFTLAFSSRTGWGRCKSSVQKMLIRGMGYAGNASLMILGFEGTEIENEIGMQRAFRCMKNIRHLDLGPGVGEKWLRDRFHLPYLREELMEQGFLVDTFETAVSWSGLPHLYEEVRKKTSEVFASQGVRSVLCAHISHLYAEGASLYFMVLARQLPDREIRQWQEFKRAISRAIVELGSPISHHHGIGADHLEYWHQQACPFELESMKELKRRLDPEGIMNPGKLL